MQTWRVFKPARPSSRKLEPEMEQGSHNQSFHGLAGTEAMRRMGMRVEYEDDEDDE